MKLAYRVIYLVEGKESLKEMITRKFKITEWEDGLGFSESSQKWYGYSHRAIHGFGIGDKLFEVNWVHPDDDPKLPWDEQKNTLKTKYSEHGTVEIKTLEQAKEAAKNFADSVS